MRSRPLSTSSLHALDLGLDQPELGVAGRDLLRQALVLGLELGHALLGYPASPLPHLAVRLEQLALRGESLGGLGVPRAAGQLGRHRE